MHPNCYQFLSAIGNCQCKGSAPELPDNGAKLLDGGAQYPRPRTQQLAEVRRVTEGMSKVNFKVENHKCWAFIKENL